MFRHMPYHRDTRVAKALREWGTEPSGRNHNLSPHPAAAARRLFRDWDDMRAFFSLAFPAHSPLDATGVVRWGKDNIGCLSVLNTLGLLKVGADELEVAAFLVSSGNTHSVSAGGVLVLPGSEEDLKRTRRFIKLFAGLATAEQLRNLFSDWSWRVKDEADWVAGCLRVGISYDCMEALVNHYNWVSHYNEWSPEEILGYMQAGAPAAYLTHFWDWRTRFQKLWADGLPYEYAVALTEEDA